MKKWLFSTKGMNIDWAALILRLAFGGIMMLSHGKGKLNLILNWTSESKFADPIGLGEYNSLTLTVFAEFICAMFLVLGLFTRVSSFLLAFTMGVAYFVIHASDPFKQGEMSFIYFIVFTLLLFTGPGKYSIDALIGGKKK